MSDQNDASKRLHDSDHDDDDSLFGKEAERDLSSSPVQVFDSFGSRDDRDAFSDQASSNSGGNPYGGGASPYSQPVGGTSAGAAPYSAANPYQQVYGQPGGGAGGTQPYAGVAGSGAGDVAGSAGGSGDMPPYQPYAGGQAAGGASSGQNGYAGQAYPGGYPDGYADAPAPSTGKATGALACGILAILFSGTVLVSIVLGIVAIVLAGSYIRSGGMAGTAKAGRVCGVVGIVFSVISLIFYIVFGVAVFQAAMNDYDIDDIYDYSHDHSITHEAPRGGYGTYDAEEQAAVDAVNAQLDLLAAGDQAMLEAIGAMANKGFTSSLDVTMEECGIDPVAYARTMTSGMTYQVSIVSADEESGGFVSCDVRCRDVFDVLDEFYDSLTDLQSSGAASLMSDEQLKARIGELFTQAVSDADFEEDFYISLDVMYENGEWVIDPASWDDEMDYLFGLG